MPLSRSRDFLSIGEVLEAIKVDFPDVSISKIRFLESEGLINPERTGSGYRKFYDPDVARLRYILSLQKEQFLPLRVIRERLADADASGSIPAIEPAGGGSATSVPAKANGSAKAPRISTDVQLDRTGLSEASGLSDDELQGLEDFGLIAAGDFYDGNDLAVAKAARRLLDYGLEPRHLRMYRQWADREASFFEQIVAPMARRKDPSSQMKAAQSSQDLIGLSQQIRDAMLRTSMKQLF
ncbi:MAG: MerR family transcriptional regulator [Actinobacteria bacterium]|nr:MerR family transcriptional regulator [Actinomycetota bacterium]